MWSSYAVEAILTLIVVAVIIYLWTLCHPPRGFAPGLPVIPIWVSLLPLIRSRLGKPLLPQDEVYIRYHRIPIEQKGAVVIFFGGRWNVLVARPCAVRAFFTHEKDLYHKSGNHLKLPNAVISQLTGGNIISEHGEKWKRYASVIRPAIKSKINHDGANEATRRLSRHLDELKGVVSMVPLVQRFAMENVALSVFQRDLGFLSDTLPYIHQIHSAVKKHIFHPLFLSFPQLDDYPSIFPSRTLARDSIRALETALLRDLGGPAPTISSRGGEKCRSDPTLATGLEADPDQSSVLHAIKEAHLSGAWTEREYNNNLKILFIAGHENIQQALLSMLWLLASDQARQHQYRSLGDSLEDSPNLWAFMHEALRLYPPIPQLFNRQTAQDVELILDEHMSNKQPNNPPKHNIRIKQGTYIGWSAFALHRSSAATCWQPDPLAFRPDRWGSSVDEIDRLAVRATSLGEFATFHGGPRACPGRAFAMRTLRAVLTAILLRYRITMPVDYKVELSPGGLLAPRELLLNFDLVEGRE